MIRVSTFLLLGGTILVSGSTFAAIRVYNPETGSSESAATFEGTERPTAPQILNNPESEVKLAPLPILEEDDTFTQESDTSLGKAIFFVDFRRFHTEKLARELQELKKFPGVTTSFYMESKDPKQYAVDLIKSLRNKKINPEQHKDLALDLPEVKADLRGEVYAYHRPGGWHKVVYYDGTGSRRVYGLEHGLEKFFRHVKRVQRSKQKRPQ